MYTYTYIYNMYVLNAKPYIHREQGSSVGRNGCWRQVHVLRLAASLSSFGFLVGNTLPKSVKCIHSATKV